MLPQHMLHMMCQLHIQLPPMRSPSISTISQCGIGQQPKRMHGKNYLCVYAKKGNAPTLLARYLPHHPLPPHRYQHSATAARRAVWSSAEKNGM